MWSVILRDGFDKASHRRLAAELGTTIGLLTHYFSSKEELLIFALDEFLDHMEQAMNDGSDGKKGLDRLIGMLSMALPLDEERLALWRVWMSFVVHALKEGKPRRVFQKRYVEIRDRIAGEIEVLQEQGVINPALDPKIETFFLIATIDGIAIRAAMGPEKLSAKTISDQFRRQLEQQLKV